MSYVKSNSADLVVTSPPYWDMKNYESSDQIGYKEDYPTYLNRMGSVWTECSRTLKENGVFIININTKSEKGSLKLIPNDFIKQLESLGWNLRDVLYWHKSSAIPQKNNFGDHFEYFLIFSRTQKIQSNKMEYFDYKMNEIRNFNSWNINKKFGSVGKKYMIHPAVFPVELIQRLILIFTKENGLVIDPFLGSGTSLISSFISNRRFIGYELNNEEYKKLIVDRLLEYKINPNLIHFLDNLIDPSKDCHNNHDL